MIKKQEGKLTLNVFLRSNIYLKKIKQVIKEIKYNFQMIDFKRKRYGAIAQETYEI